MSPYFLNGKPSRHGEIETEYQGEVQNVRGLQEWDIDLPLIPSRITINTPQKIRDGQHIFGGCLILGGCLYFFIFFPSYPFSDVELHDALLVVAIVSPS